MSMVVWDSTGSICKVNGYLSRMGFYVSDFAVCDGDFTLLYFVQMGAWVV